MLIIFSGSSGVGKNTVIEHLLANDDFALMPTYTTREKRENERDGYPYYFITDDEFRRKIEEGEFYEYQKVHNHYYGTSKKLLSDSLALGKILLKDIDVLGTQNLLKTVSDDIKIVTVFLKVDSADKLVERLTVRGEKNIDLRLKRYKMEQQYAVDYDYIINNNSLDDTIDTMMCIINNEKSDCLPACTHKLTDREIEKVYEMADRLRDGQKLEPVKIAIKNKSIFITDGHCRYLASVLTGKRVAKEVIEPCYIEEVDLRFWEETVDYFKKKK